VECGMALEEAPPETIPKLDPAAANRVLEDLIEMLPLLRQPLSPEEKARLRPVSPARTEKMKEVVDELVAADPEDLANAGIEMSHEKLVAMRESFDKTDMLGEVERELQAYMAELQEHRRRLAESAAEMMARIKRAAAERAADEKKDEEKN
jgi:hypothetical protein